MRLPLFLPRSLLLLLGLLSLTLAVDPEYPSTAILSYEFISSPSTSKPSHLATINYDPSTLRYTLVSWTPPSTDSLQSPADAPTSAPLIRILSPSGSSTVTTLSTFLPSLKQHINLYLSTTSVLSASITTTSPVPLTPEEADYLAKVERAKARGKPIPAPPKPSKPKTKKPKKGDNRPVVQEQPIDITPEGQPKVNLVPELEGPRPKLLSRAPPQVDEHGNEVVQQEVVEKSFLQKYWWVILGAVVLLMGAGGEGK
jgi:hypothetical protein